MLATRVRETRADLNQAFEIQPVLVILASMPSLNDDQQKTGFGDVLADELKVILEYVKGIPALEEEIIRIYVTVNDICQCS